MTRTLYVALIGGTHFDALYARIPEFERLTGYRVEIIAQLPLAELNRFITAAYADGKRPAIDLLATHTTYAPAQADFLLPLDDLISHTDISDFHPAALQPCKFAGHLYQLPRRIDTRLFFYRTDLLKDQRLHQSLQQTDPLTVQQLQPPLNWDEVSAYAQCLTAPPGRYGYAFPGHSDGLFGTFCELVAMAGGRLFDEEQHAIFDAEAVSWALDYMQSLQRAGCLPPAMSCWNRDEVSASFRQGEIAFVTDTPGATTSYNDPQLSHIVGKYAAMRYPTGPTGQRAVYSGMHSFAIPTTTRDRWAAFSLLTFLLNAESQWLEAEQGAYPVRLSTTTRLRKKLQKQHDTGTLRHLTLLEETIKEDMLIPPPLAHYPKIEDALYPLIQHTLLGQMTISEATQQLRTRAMTI